MDLLDNELMEKRRKNRDYMKQYQQRNIYYKCSCGGSIFKQYNRTVHNKSQRHIEYKKINDKPIYKKINMEEIEEIPNE
jgi:hypothetical protein